MIFPEDFLRAFVISLGTFILGAVTAVVWIGMRRGIVLRQEDSPPALRVGWPIAYSSLIAALVLGRWQHLGELLTAQAWMSLVALLVNAVLLGWTLAVMRVKHRAARKSGTTVDVETS